MDVAVWLFDRRKPESCGAVLHNFTITCFLTRLGPAIPSNLAVEPCCLSFRPWR